MHSPREFVVVAGEGALLGALAGAGRGFLDVLAHDDLSHRMLWIAAERTIAPASWWAPAGAGAALLLAAVLSIAVRRGAGRFRLAVGVCAGLALTAALLLAGPWRNWLIPDPASTSLPAAIFGVAVQVGAGVALVAGRLAAAGGAPTVRLRGWVAVAGCSALVVLGAGRFGLVAANGARCGDRPSVILISLDTLRADRMGELGGPKDLMPNLDAFARDALLFTQAQAPAPWTLPSHASIFTAQLPFDHGTRWSSSRIPPSRAVLAEHLRNAGYLTVSFNGDAYVGRAFGFAQGFEIYDERDEEIHGGLDGVVDDALAWILANRRRPFFAFVHTYEPHSPYIGVERADPADRGRLPETFTFDVVARVHDGDLVLDERERRYVRALYDGDSARTDRAIGRFFGALREAGILDRAIVIVFSDHGEALWDREGDRSPGHGHSLARELLHVPWIVRGPGIVHAARVETPVGLVDLSPTLLAWLGLPADPAHRGRNLVTTWRTGEAPEPEPVYAESVEYGPDRFAVLAQGYKAIVVTRPDVVHGAHKIATKPLEVYDLAADPLETIDLGARPPTAAASSVALAYERARRKLGTSEAHVEADTSSEELQRTLRSLGYVR